MNEFLPYIIDVCVIFIFVWYLARGWRKGLARTLVTMLSCVFANNNYEAYAALGVNSFGDYIGVFLANIVVNAIALLGVFLAAFLVLRLVGRSLSLVNHIPLLGLANRGLGMVANGIIGYFVIQLVMFIFTMMATGQNFFAGVVLGIENSTVAVWFYHTNYLVDWIMKIFA